MIRILLAVALMAGAVSFGCTDDDDDSGFHECDPGEPDCECLPDGGCDDGYECDSAWVEDPNDPDSFILEELCQ